MKRRRSSSINVAALRLPVQLIAAAALLYLGTLGVKLLSVFGMAVAIPTFSCHYIDNRFVNCALYELQFRLPQVLDPATWRSALAALGALALMFALSVGVFGRAWCGWVCPLGLLQDFITRARALLRLPAVELSERWCAGLRTAKYALVTVTVLLLLSIGAPHFFMARYRLDYDLAYCQICPSKKFLSGMSKLHTLKFTSPRDFSESVAAAFPYVVFVDDMTPVTTVMSWLAIGTGFLFVAGSWVVRRFWCRICPLGALMGFCARFALMTLRKDGVRCTKCGICRRVCPTQVQMVYEEKDIPNVMEEGCILCLRCVELCPERDCLTAKVGPVTVVRSSPEVFFRASLGGGRSRVVRPEPVRREAA